MIVKISGDITYRGDGFVIVESHGLGYKIHFPNETIVDLIGSVSLYTHEVIRDNEREFYGFVSLESLEMFWRLIGVSGVGPRTAQRIVLQNSIDELRAKIMQADLSFLINTPGIGTKTAQKIILELKGVLTQIEEPVVKDQEAVDALVSLGYSRRHAREALRGIEGDSTEDIIRSALKVLSF